MGEELTLGGATKRVDCTTQTRAMQEEQYSKAVFKEHEDHCLTKPPTSGRARPENIVKPSY